MSDTKLSNLIKSAHIHVGHTKIKYDRNDLFLLYFDNDVNVAESKDNADDTMMDEEMKGDQNISMRNYLKKKT